MTNAQAVNKIPAHAENLAGMDPLTGRPAAEEPVDGPDRIDTVDLDLLDGLRQRKPEAYEVLLELYEAPIYRFFYYSHGDHDLAQDQCSETFANFIVAVQKMRGDLHCLKPFLFGVARNVMRRNWRQRKVYQFDPEAMDFVTDPHPTAYQQVVNHQEYDRAMKAIEEFGEPARQILLLRFVEELSLNEVSEAMDLPVGTIKSHIHRCRKRLKQLLGMG